MAKKKVVRATPAKKGPKPGSVRVNSVDVAAQWNKNAKDAEKEAARLAEAFGTSLGAIKRALQKEWSGSQYRETFQTSERRSFNLTPEQLCEELNKDKKINETADRLEMGYQTMNNWIKKWKASGVIGNPWVVLKK